MSDTNEFNESSNDVPEAPESADTRKAANRPAFALTNRVLALGTGLVSVAAFLFGYVVKDITADHARPSGDFVRMERSAGVSPGMPGAGGPGGPFGAGGLAGGDAGGKRLESATAGTVTSVNGNEVTIKTQSGETAKVDLGDDTFIIVHKIEQEK